MLPPTWNGPGSMQDMYSPVGQLRLSPFYALVLDDGNPEERQLGMQAGKSLLWLCDELWIFGDHVSAGMREEIRFCQNLGLKIRTITEKQFASGKAP